MRLKFILISVLSLLNTLLVTGVSIFDRLNAGYSPVRRHQIHPSLFAVGIFVLSFVVITAIFFCVPLFNRHQKA